MVHQTTGEGLCDDSGVAAGRDDLDFSRLPSAADTSSLLDVGDPEQVDPRGYQACRSSTSTCTTVLDLASSVDHVFTDLKPFCEAVPACLRLRALVSAIGSFCLCFMFICLFGWLSLTHVATLLTPTMTARSRGGCCCTVFNYFLHGAPSFESRCDRDKSFESFGSESSESKIFWF